MIVELEVKIAEKDRIYKEDTKNFKLKIHELEENFKSMEKKMSSDIELLEAECRSLHNFRVQRDELMTKFELQEQNLKDQETQHQKILYENERKMILDKKNLRENVENKLLELSNEFTKKNELRVAASTQRLVRENISLNLELDRLMATVDRLQAENNEVKKRSKEIACNREIDMDQIKRLVKTATQQVKIIEKMTSENERLRAMRNPQDMLKNARSTFEELSECKRKLKILERHVNLINFDNHKLKNESDYIHKENERIDEILRNVRLTIKSTIRGETVQDDPEFREYQRQNFPHELLSILGKLESQNSKSSLATLPSISNVYHQSMHHETDWPTIYETVDEIIAKRLPMAELDKSIIETPNVSSISSQPEEESESDVNCLLDVVSGSLRFPTESEGSESDVGDIKKENQKFNAVIKTSSMSLIPSKESNKIIAHAALSDDDQPISIMSSIPEDSDDAIVIIQKFGDTDIPENTESDED